MASLSSELFGSSIIVEVGTPPTEFSINEALLVTNSGFFKGAMSGSFLESKTRTVPLHDDDPEIFELLVNWLHTGNLKDHEIAPTGHEAATEEEQAADPGPASKPPNPATTLPQHIHQLCRLWILADKLQVPALQNATTAALISAATCSSCPPAPLPAPATLELVAANTLPTSPLRALAIDMALLTGAAHGLATAVSLDDDDDDATAAALSPALVRALAARALAFWAQETACSPLAKRAHLARAHACYAVGPIGGAAREALALPCAHVARLRAREEGGRDRGGGPAAMRPCAHERAAAPGPHLPCRGARVRMEARRDAVLVAECADGRGGWREARFNLDDAVMNSNGEFVWVPLGAVGYLSTNSRELEVVVEGGEVVLVGLLTRFDGLRQRRRLVLSERIINVGGELRYIGCA